MCLKKTLTHEIFDDENIDKMFLNKLHYPHIKEQKLVYCIISEKNL